MTTGFPLVLSAVEALVAFFSKNQLLPSKIKVTYTYLPERSSKIEGRWFEVIRRR
jgi:hypothetical protein